MAQIQWKKQDVIQKFQEAMNQTQTPAPGMQPVQSPLVSQLLQRANQMKAGK